jgi:hypothetical protein
MWTKLCYKICVEIVWQIDDVYDYKNLWGWVVGFKLHVISKVAANKKTIVISDTHELAQGALL